jgi:hypothetical protein
MNFKRNNFCAGCTKREDDCEEWKRIQKMGLMPQDNRHFLIHSAVHLAVLRENGPRRE